MGLPPRFATSDAIFDFDGGGAKSCLLAAIGDTGTSTGSFKRFAVRRATFDSNRIDISILTGSIKDALVEGSHFLNGGPEAVRLNPSGGCLNTIIIGNHFRNYLNDVTGADADGHFIRATGQYCVVANNSMMDLNCSGNDGLDTEALRLECSDAIVIGNTIINGGLAEGAIAIKADERCLVANNNVSTTAAYRAAHSGIGVSPRGVVVSGKHPKISGNIFRQITGTLCEFTGSTTMGIAEFSNNTIIDCSGETTRMITAANTGATHYRIFGNLHTTDDEGAVGQPTAQAVYAKGCGNDSVIDLYNNEWRTGDILLEGPDNGKTIKRLTIKGDRAKGTVAHAVFTGGGIIQDIDIDVDLSADLSGTDFFDIDAQSGAMIGGPARFRVSISRSHTGAVARIFQIPVPNGKIANVRYDVVGRGSDGGVSRYVYEGTYLGGSGAITIQGGALDTSRVTTAANWSAADLSPAGNLLQVRLGGRNTFTTIWSGEFVVSIV